MSSVLNNNKQNDYLGKKQMTESTNQAPLPPPCACDIYNDGKIVAILTGLPPEIEQLVKGASKLEPVMDWHYFGGRALVKTLGEGVQAYKNLVKYHEDNKHTLPTVKFYIMEVESRNGFLYEVFIA